MEKINKVLLKYVFDKANKNIGKKSFDHWVELWFEILGQCPKELKKYQTSEELND